MAPTDDASREKGKIRADIDIMNVTARVEALTEALQRHISEVQYRRPAYGYAGMRRPRAHGKFLFVGDEKFWIRGVTYGTFKPDAAGMQFPAQGVVERDFRAIADAGLNSIRVYTAPPLWLMDAAAACGFRGTLGVWGGPYTSCLTDPTGARSI